MIVDVHTHAFAREHFTDKFLEDAKRAKADVVKMLFTFEEYMEAMKPVDKAVVFGMKARRTGLYVPNEFIADWVARAPQKLIGFMSLDPTEDDFMEDFERSYHDLKLRGVKLGPIYAGFDPTDRRLDALYQKCAEFNLPILFHTGTSFVQFGPLAYTRPYLWDDVALRFPGLKIIMAHLAHPWEAECIAVIRKHPNVYADLSALYYRPWQFYNSMVLCQEYGVTHKLLFGSDFPFTTPQSSLDGIRAINRLVEGTNLPPVREDVVEGLVHRDSLALLYG